MDKKKWAIAGTGYISNRFAEGMLRVSDVNKAAVCSRTDASAAAFADKYGIAAHYTDFEEMLAKEKPDVVYLAIPNSCHFDYVDKALAAGINVLCEKPMADNLKQFEALRKKASEKDLFLMEGMWTRCFPAVRKAKEWIAEGGIGEVLSVRVHFDIKPDRDDWQVWKAGIKYAAGALRDVGIYSLAMAYLAFKDDPQKVFSNWRSNGEVDESADLMLIYGSGRTALLSGAFNRESELTAHIIGEDGRIETGPLFFCPHHTHLYRGDKLVKEFDDPYEGNGFQYEIMHVNDCLRQGLKESPDFTLDEGARICRLIDTLRQEWGIVYDADR